MVHWLLIYPAKNSYSNRFPGHHCRDRFPGYHCRHWFPGHHCRHWFPGQRLFWTSPPPLPPPSHCATCLPHSKLTRDDVTIFLAGNYYLPPLNWAVSVSFKSRLQLFVRPNHTCSLVLSWSVHNNHTGKIVILCNCSSFWISIHVLLLSHMPHNWSITCILTA